jgi:hypothetical protein
MGRAMTADKPADSSPIRVWMYLGYVLLDQRPIFIITARSTPLMAVLIFKIHRRTGSLQQFI